MKSSAYFLKDADPAKGKEDDTTANDNAAAEPVKPTHRRLLRKIKKPSHKTDSAKTDNTEPPANKVKSQRHRLFKTKTPREPAPKLLEVDNISPSYELTHTGDLTIKGDIHDGARLNLTNCNLTIIGKINGNVVITLRDTEPKDKLALHIDEFKVNGIAIACGLAKKRVTIHGEVGQNVTIHGAHTRTDICIFKSIGSHCKITTGSGHINVGHIGQQCALETNVGQIRAMTADTDSSLKVVTAGIVDIWKVTGKISISSPNGEIYMQQATGLTELTLVCTNETNVLLNGFDVAAEVKRQHEKQTQASSVNRPT